MIGTLAPAVAIMRSAFDVELLWSLLFSKIYAVFGSQYINGILHNISSGDEENAQIALLPRIDLDLESREINEI